MDNTKKVYYYQGEAVKDTKELTWPQKYEDFIKDIIQNFDLTNKNISVILKVVTDDGDENNVYSQEDLEGYLEDDNIKEFKFSIEENKDSGGLKNQEPMNIKELEKLLDPNLLKEEEDLDVDSILKDMFDKDEYKRKKEEEENKYSDIFNQSLEKSMEEILSQQSKTMEEEINKKLNNYSELFAKDKKEAYNSIMDIKDNLVNIKDQTEEMSGAIKELRDSIQNNQLILASSQKISQLKIKIDNNNNRDNNNKKKINNNSPQISGIKNNDNFANPLGNIMDEREEENENVISIKFEKRKIEKTPDIKEAKFLNIDDIRMINDGIHSYKNLCFVKDEENSSEEINFFGHNKHTDIFELTMAGEFEPNSNAIFSVTVAINNPKPEQIYKMVIYVREKNSKKNLSEPLEINVKTKQAEDPIQQRQKRAEEIYEDLKKEFHDYEDLINKNEIINQLLENNLDKEAIKKSLNTKIQEIKEKQNNEKAEQIFQELKFYGFDLGKEQMIGLIKENNFNLENVQNYINERISEQIYDNLSKLDVVDFNNNSKEEVLKKIKELNFNVDDIKESYKKRKVIEPIVNPANEGNGDDEEVDKLFQELEDEYGITGFIDEEAAKAKIRELNCNRDQIVDWIENNLLNGDN